MARFLKDHRKKQGMAPGSLVFIGKQRMEHPTLQLMQYNAEGVNEASLHDFSQLSPSVFSPDNVAWIQLCGLHDTTLIASMGERFSISPLILEDILNTDQRPRYSEDDKHLYVIIKALYHNPTDQRVHMEQIALIVGDYYLISIQESERNFFQGVKKRIADRTFRIRRAGADYLCYSLIDSLIDNYIITIELLGNAIEEQEKGLLLSNREIRVEDIYRYKTELSYMRKNIRPVKEIMSRFTSSDSPLIGAKTYPFLHDLDDLSTQALEAIEIYYTMVGDQMNIYQTNINYRINDVMKVLTIFSAVFIPLTFIVGVYGMNFKFMPELSLRWAYPILWGVMLLLAGFMLWYFKRKRWF